MIYKFVIGDYTVLYIEKRHTTFRSYSPIDVFLVSTM